MDVFRWNTTSELQILTVEGENVWNPPSVMRGISDIYTKDSENLELTSKYFIKMPEPKAKVSWAEFDEFALGACQFYGLYHDKPGQWI